MRINRGRWLQISQQAFRSTMVVLEGSQEYIGMGERREKEGMRRRKEKGRGEKVLLRYVLCRESSV